MDLTGEQLEIASRLDTEVRRLIQGGNDDVAIFAAMADSMPEFERLMESSKRGELDELCGRFAGLYRYAKILETIAARIHSGEIKVPK